VVILSLLLALSAAQPLDMDSAFLDGRDLYEKLRPEEALRSFELALGRPGRTDEEKARLHVWMALCHGVSGELEVARGEIELAFELHDAVTLPEGAPPKVAGLFHEVKEARRPPEPTPPPVEPEPSPELTVAEPELQPQPASERGDGTLVLWSAVGAAAFGGAAVASLVGASFFAVDATALNAEANRDDATQVEVVTALQGARGSASAAYALLGTSGLLTAGGVTFAVLAMLGGDDP
jgi:hypothetical protein